jgi:hypothetical protein
MTQANRSIFRKSAWQQYVQRRERAELPRYVTPPVFALFWTLLALLFILGSVAWGSEVPIYTTVPAILRENGAVSALQSNGYTGLVAVVFLPADRPLTLHPGLPVHLQIGTVGPQATGTLILVEPGVLSPQQARQRYGLDSSEGLLITQPSSVVIASISSPLPRQMYTGSIVTAQVQTGSQRLLALLLGMRN